MFNYFMVSGELWRVLVMVKAVKAFPGLASSSALCTLRSANELDPMAPLQKWWGANR